MAGSRQVIPVGKRAWHKTPFSQTERPPVSKLVEAVSDLEWYALRVPPQKEFIAQEILTRRGIVTYCPTDRRWRRRNRYHKTKELVPYTLLPRLVLVGFIPGVPAWFNLFNLPLVQSCIGIGGRPVPLDPKAVRRMMLRYSDGLQRPKEERYMRTHAEYKAGDLVRICDGPFDQMIVPVQEIDGKDAVILMELFGAQHEVRIPADALEAA